MNTPIEPGPGELKVPNYIDKQEVVRRANALIEAQNVRINNQVKAINRLLARWNDIGAFVDGMADMFTERKDGQGLFVVQAIMNEMARLETNDPDPEPADVIVPG